jgi:hypothetical protein
MDEIMGAGVGVPQAGDPSLQHFLRGLLNLISLGGLDKGLVIEHASGRFEISQSNPQHQRCFAVIVSTHESSSRCDRSSSQCAGCTAGVGDGAHGVRLARQGWIWPHPDQALPPLSGWALSFSQADPISGTVPAIMSATRSTLLNFPVFGQAMARVRQALLEQYGFTAEQIGFVKAFAEPLPASFATAALLEIIRGLEQGACSIAIRRESRLLQQAKVSFWQAASAAPGSPLPRSSACPRPLSAPLFLAMAALVAADETSQGHCQPHRLI